MALRLDFKHVPPSVQTDAKRMMKEAQAIRARLFEGRVRGGEFTGWTDWPQRFARSDELKRIKETAARLRANSDVVVVVGIGGSYLGAKALIEALGGYFEKHETEVVFAGHHLSGAYLEALADYLQDKRFSVIVISKSGTTTEPAIAFRSLRGMLEERHGRQGAAERIVAVTDPEKGALCALAAKEGYETYPVPEDIGGRFSVFTAVGMLPSAVAGLDVDALISGALEAMETLREKDDACLYAATRKAFYDAGKKIELFVTGEPAFTSVSEWWKQLFGESEGKDGKGLFVASAAFTTDLHSLGQYVQDGERHLFETMLTVDEEDNDMRVTPLQDGSDGLGYLEGRRLDDVNETALEATALAHLEGGVGVIGLRLRRRDANALGYLLYFFMLACGIGGVMLGVNPFDQPGVEAYKKNMFALLGKPGFEAARAALEKRLKR